jgi:hypothetical protein
MTMSRLRVFLAAGAVAFTSLAGATPAPADTPEPTREGLARAVTDYLADHGDLCVGKFTWPRTVTAQDEQEKTNDAVQLPVLERLGLVVAADMPAPGAAVPGLLARATAGAATAGAGPEGAQPVSGKVYSLTEKGRRYYLQRKHVTLGAHDLPTEHDADLCVGHLSLDKVVKWSPPERVRGDLVTLVQYTYHIEAADWMADPEARQVFPVIDRIIRHDGNLLMSVSVKLEDGRWRPVLPVL